MTIPLLLLSDLREIIKDEYNLELNEEASEELAEGLLALARLASPGKDPP